MIEAEARQALKRVLELLSEAQVSVSSVTKPSEGWNIHVADSFSGLEVPELAHAKRIGDIGSGAGFPGLALAAVLPEAEVDLIESLGRKCEFMRSAIDVSGIGNARVVQARAEEWAAGEGAGRYQVITARAVGRLAMLAELASPLLVEGGALVAWKGARDTEEEDELDSVAESVAMRRDRVLPVQPFAESRNRHLHVLVKSGPTPGGLPRRPGMARKRPFRPSRNP